ncbi:MAG: uroporphyrinogen-III C-methyltransferase [Francisellaceae bacterium]
MSDTNLPATLPVSQKIRCAKPLIIIVFVTLILAIIAIAIAGLSLYRWQNLKTTIAAKPVAVDFVTSAQLNTVSAELKTLERELVTKTEAQSQLEKQLNQLQRQVAENARLKQYIDERMVKAAADNAALKQQMGQIEHSYMLPTNQLVEQLELMHIQVAISDLGMAKEAFVLLRNKDKALYFIRAAKTEIRQIKNAGVLVAAIDQIEIKLENITSVALKVRTINDLSNTLSTLEMIDPLKVKKPTTPAVHSLGWQDSMTRSWQQLKSLVSVERLDQRDQELINTNNRLLIIEEIRLRLSQLKLALFNNLDAEFNDDKRELDGLVNRYFSDDQALKSWKAKLAGLNLDKQKSTVDAIDQLITQLTTKTANLEQK